MKRVLFTCLILFNCTAFATLKFTTLARSKLYLSVGASLAHTKTRVLGFKKNLNPVSLHLISSLLSCLNLKGHYDYSLNNSLDFRPNNTAKPESFPSSLAFSSSNKSKLPFYLDLFFSSVRTKYKALRLHKIKFKDSIFSYGLGLYSATCNQSAGLGFMHLNLADTNFKAQPTRLKYKNHIRYRQS